MATPRIASRRTRAAGAVAASAAALMLVPALGSHAEDITCFGQAANVVGTDGDESVTGTMGDDVIAGLGGSDSLHGLDGDDLICGGDGSDVLSGDGGKDSLDGGEGDDGCDSTNGAGQAEGSEVHENCETVAEPQADDAPNDDPGKRENPVLALIPDV